MDTALGNRPPLYPTSARGQGVEGQVVLVVRVTRAGRPHKVSVRRSSGAAILDRAARRAVEKWRFRPAMKDGQAVESEVVVPIVFRLLEQLRFDPDHQR